jgi:hypothetical protein
MRERKRRRGRTLAGTLGELAVARANELIAERERAKRDGDVVEAKPVEDATPIAAE